MQKISSLEIAKILNFDSDIVDVKIINIATDSRKIQKDDLFIAVKGENFDGHNFVHEVIKKGAAIVIVSRLIEDIDVKRQIVVKDTLKAYGKIGAYVRSLFKGVVVGLTGSAGKTTTTPLNKDRT